MSYDIFGYAFNGYVTNKVTEDTNKDTEEITIGDLMLLVEGDFLYWDGDKGCLVSYEYEITIGDLMLVTEDDRHYWDGDTQNLKPTPFDWEEEMEYIQEEAEKLPEDTPYEENPIEWDTEEEITLFDWEEERNDIMEDTIEEIVSSVLPKDKDYKDEDLWDCMVFINQRKT